MNRLLATILTITIIITMTACAQAADKKSATGNAVESKEVHETTQAKAKAADPAKPSADELTYANVRVKIINQQLAELTRRLQVHPDMVLYNSLVAEKKQLEVILAPEAPKK